MEHLSGLIGEAKQEGGGRKGEAGSGLFAPWESDSDLRRHFRDGAFLHMIWPHVHWEQQISMVHVAKANSERAKGSF